MIDLTRSDAPPGNDPILLSYLAASSEGEATTQLSVLLSDQAMPIIDQILCAKKTSRTSRDFDEVENVASAARECLLGQLHRLRTGKRENPIRDFLNYAASVTYSAWAEMLRVQYPQRALLLNRLRYLLEGRTNRRGFAIWDDAAGAKWCGFASWRMQKSGLTPKQQWLMADPTAAANQALPATDPTTISLPELVAGFSDGSKARFELARSQIFSDFQELYLMRR